jgi:hypothetical protein
MQNPWYNLPMIAPFVLEIDRAAIHQFNSTAFEKHKLRVDAFPGPFIGRPDAPVVLLNLNPGFSENDLVQDIEGMWRNIKTLHHQEMDYPFFLLDPTISQSGGYRWWYKRLRTLVERYDAKFVAKIFYVLNCSLILRSERLASIVKIRCRLKNIAFIW